MAAECVLLYNCDTPQWAKLRQILVMLRLRVRMVSPAQYGLPLERVAAGKAGDAAAEVEEEFTEPMMVFCHLTDARLDQVLTTLRRASLPPVGLKAVLTRTNREWDSRQLWTELRRERQAIGQGGQAHSAGEQKQAGT